MNVCECGRIHVSDTEATWIGQNGLSRLPEMLSQSGAQSVLLVADKNTYAVAGMKVVSLLRSFERIEMIYDDDALVPDEAAVGKLFIATGKRPDLILALGSGSINDICRYVSFRTGVPYIIVATAPSMDGYASNVSPLLVNGLKITYEAHVAKGIIGDADLLKTAPAEMTAAGLGDMLGKYVCLNDWELSRIVNREYYCERVAGLTRESVRKCVSSVDGLVDGEPQAIADLMDGLVLSGVAMSYVGNSRPASGAEHHLSHYWEMMFLFDGRPPVLHGAKVGVATLVMIRLISLLMEEQPDWEQAIQKASEYDFEAYRQKMRSVYRHAAAEILADEAKSGRNNRENTIKRIRAYQENWELIRQTLEKNIPDYDEVKGLLTKLKSPVSPADIGVRKEELIGAVCYAKELRQRYTILQMMGDLGLLTRYAQLLADFYYNL